MCIRDRFPDLRSLGRALLPFATATDRAQWEPAFGAPDAQTLVRVVTPAVPAESAVITPADPLVATRAATLDPRESVSPPRPTTRARKPWVPIVVGGGVLT